MNARDAETLGRSLIAEHLDGSWRLELDRRSVRRFGQCRYDARTIRLSAQLAELNNEERVRNTLLHEIAHALAGPAAGHGPTWKRIARMIGCDARARYDSAEVNIPKARYTGTCPRCGKTVDRCRLTASTSRSACSSCCRRFGGGRYDERFLFEWTDNNEVAPKIEAPKVGTEADLVRRIRTAREAGQSWRVLSAALNEAGIATISGKAWSASGATAFHFAERHGLRDNGKG